MNIHLYRSPRSIRVSFVTIAMLVTSTFFAAGNASADVLIPLVDTGGGGGGGSSALVADAEQVRVGASGNQVTAF